MNRSAFSHRPARLANDVFVHPVHTKELWTRLWAAARSQDWWEEGVGYVGDLDGFYYFQIPGLRTGFARLSLDSGEVARAETVRALVHDIFK